MSLASILNEFNASVAQCDNLIVNSHQTNIHGASLLPLLDRKQITVAAFLNAFIAWESFLESSLIALMTGSPTLSGSNPVRFVSPPSPEAARALIIGINRYFDHGNHENVRKIVNLFFQHGYPYEPHLSSIYSDLGDLRTMRNSSAHITSTTQKALESLALGILSLPAPNIDLYTLLTTVDPRSAGGDTVFLTYKNKLVAAAELIARG